MLKANEPAAINAAYPLLCAKLARPTVPVYRADNRCIGRADANDMRRVLFVATIAKAVKRRDGAITRLYLRALPGEISKPIAEDCVTTVRDGMGFSHHMQRCAAYAE